MGSGRKVLVTALVGTVAAVALSALLSVSGRAGADREVGRGDCTFLERPEDFLEAQQARRERLQELTYLVSSRLTGGRDAAGPLTLRNLIDLYTFAKMQRDGVAPARLCSDTEFLRRVYLDLTGRIPSANDVRAFLENTSPNKRDQVIDALVGSPEYVDRWTMFFGDLLRNTIANAGSNRYYQGRNAFYSYIKESIASNKPYHAFVGEMLVANGSSFTDGQVNYLAGFIAAMGPVQDTYDLMWHNVSTQFLGMQTYDCLLCHDGRGHLDQLNLGASRGTRMEAWKLAAFFSRANLRRAPGTEQNRPYLLEDRPNGFYLLNTTAGNRTPRQAVDGVNTVAPEYVFTGQRTPTNFREALSDFLTSDPQFARAAVNYLWAELMGLGLVDPPDSFDLARLDLRNPPPAPWGIQPSHPELLEALAQEFVNSGFNLQHVLKLIVKSSTYQLSSRYDGPWKDAYTSYFARKLVRRLRAEEIHDAVVKATGVPVSYTVLGFSTPFRWAMELPDTTEPRGNGVVNFLNNFGRGNRDNVARTDDSSILQGLTLLNDNFVISRVRASAANSATPNLVRRVLAEGLTNKQIVDEMYLTVLGRYPTPQEEALSLNHFQGRDRTQAAENLLWALLNKVDFVFDY